MSRILAGDAIVYILLLLDLIINISGQFNVTGGSQGNISTLAFTIVVLQLAGLLCLTLIVVARFFKAADEIIQNARYRESLSKGRHVTVTYTIVPLRAALRLVLDKFWWSLAAGTVYIVVTLILQIVRLDPTWQSTTASTELRQPIDRLDNWRDDSEAASLRSYVTPEYQDSAATRQPIDITSTSGAHQTWNATDHQDKPSWLPVVVLFAHKLMSTCYYVSVIVVNRMSSRHIISQVLNVKNSQ